MSPRCPKCRQLVIDGQHICTALANSPGLDVKPGSEDDARRKREEANRRAEEAAAKIIDETRTQKAAGTFTPHRESEYGRRSHAGRYGR